MYHIQFGKKGSFYHLLASSNLGLFIFFIRTPRRGFFSPKKNTMAPCQAGALDAAAKALGVNAGALLGALLAGQANPQTDPG